jgi:predicted deacylase
MRRLVITVSNLLLVCAVCTAAERSGLTVGTASAAPGTVAIGFIDVPAGIDPGLRIPVAVFSGSRPGPVLALVAGAHGTEYASIIALEKLMSRIDPKEISGGVIIVPLVNLGSFEQKVPHVNPVDGKSMNRFYPGRPDGTQTERASYAMMREVVDKCDDLIDLHGGDLDESLVPYSYWTKVGEPRVDAATRAMALAFGLDMIIVESDWPKDPKNSRYLSNTALLHGKPAIAAEAGYAGTVETDDVERLVDGCRNVMRHLGMLPGEARLVEHPVWISRVDTVSSEETGIFYPLVERGRYVAAGQKLGYVTDWFGRTIFEARAPASGIVLYVCAVPSMKKGNAIANVGVVAAGEP